MKLLFTFALLLLCAYKLSTMFEKGALDVSASDLYQSNPYCDYQTGTSHHLNTTIIGHSYLRGDKQTSLGLINALALKEGHYNVYRR